MVMLTSPPDQHMCASYRSEMKELRAGKKESAAHRYASAYRHYARGLKVIGGAYDASMERVRLQNHVLVHDDTSLMIGKAFVENRDGYYRSASADAEGVLIEQLSTIREVYRCPR